MTIADTPDKIRAFRLLALRSALKLELKGLRGGHVNAYQVIKKEFSLKGNRQQVYEQFEAKLREMGILQPE